MLYSALKTLLFTLPPESAHDLTMRVAKLCPAFGTLTGTGLDPRLAVKVGQSRWATPVGLAAGLDKNAEALPFFAAQGFGAVECGTITKEPQLGNPKPRVWRYPEERSLRNAMGFPNHGLLATLPRLRSFERNIPVGANIGKNKDTGVTESIDELCQLFENLAAHVDYFVVNVSSPNTPGLRDLQERSYLSKLFTALNERRRGPNKDLYLKIAPDLAPEKVKELTHLAVEFKLTGLIATNTTIMPDRGPGGVSGELLTQKARAIRHLILSEAQPLELIGVGGITTPADLFDHWYHGGKVVQIYTSYIFQGPGILRTFSAAILAFLDHHRLRDLESFFALPLSERRRLLDVYPA